VSSRVWVKKFPGSGAESLGYGTTRLCSLLKELAEHENVANADFFTEIFDETEGVAA